MKFSLTKISFDKVFKGMLVISIAYILYLLTVIAIQLKSNADVWRYQFRNEGPYILDTKTGEVKKFRAPSY